MTGNRLSAAFYVILVFASGALVGVVSMRLYDTKTVAADASRAPRTMDEFRKQYLANMREKVGMNDSQIAQVNQILDDTKKKFDDIRQQEKPARDKIQQDQIDSIRALMTDPQKKAYEDWREERQRLQQQKQLQKKKRT